MSLLQPSAHLRHAMLRPSVCSQCQLLRRAVPVLWGCARGGKTFKKKILKREAIKEEVVEYVGNNPRRADRVYVWGCATTGALGIASYLRPEKYQRVVTMQRRPARVKFIDENNIRPYQVACGYGFTVFAVKREKSLQILGTGINTSSQLGYHEEPRNSGRVLDYIIRPIEIHLPLCKLSSTRVRHLGCGRAHTIIITEDGKVFSLGNNAYGQCGRPIVEGESFSKSQLVNVIKDLPDDVQKVHCGQDHTIFVTASGAVFSCGLGADGQTGVSHFRCVSQPMQLTGDLNKVKIKQVHGRGDCVLAVSEEGEVFGWGNSEYQQLGMVSEAIQVSTPTHLPLKQCGRIVKAVAGGSICAVLNDQGDVFVWGYGLLGKGPVVEYSSQPTQIPPAIFGRNELQPGSRVVDIECGLGHFAALTNEGEVYTWGLNRQGCLGLGSCDNQSFPLKVSVPAEVHTVVCGVDHTVVLCKSFT